MKDSHAFLTAVLTEAKRQKLTPAKFSRQSGLAFNSCQKLLKGTHRAPTLATVMALVQVLGCRLTVTDRAS